MYNWLVRKCKESEAFAWGVATIGIILMIIIAVI
jgi:hypothetical protein